MKKTLLAISLAGILFLSAACSGGNASKDLSDGELVAKAIDNTLNLESVEIDSTLIFKSGSENQPIDAQVNGKTKIFNDPVFIENAYTIQNVSLDSMEDYKSYIHYLNGDLVGYVFQQGAWYYGENLLFPEDIVNNPTQNLTLFIAHQAKSDFIKKDQEASTANLIKYDLHGDPSIHSWVLNQSVLNLSLGSFVGNPEALEAMGDFILSIWVDARSLNIVKMELDFTPNLQKLGQFLKDDGESPEGVVDIFEKFTYKATYDLKSHNKLERFSVPLEARVGTKLE